MRTDLLAMVSRLVAMRACDLHEVGGQDGQLR